MRLTHRLALPLVLAVAVLPSRGAAGAFDRVGEGLKSEYLFNFATSAGELAIPFNGLTYDPVGNELYVLSSGVIHIFNPSGMEVFSFGDEADLVGMTSLVVLESGDLITLVNRMNVWSMSRASFRGQVKGPFPITGVPDDFPMSEFHPVRLRYAKEKIYIVDMAGMRVLVVDDAGKYVASYDLAEILDEEDKRDDLGLRGFDVDREGNLLFTISPAFKAYVLSPDGNIRDFGRPGSAPGRFGVVAGIASDEQGRLYVSDILRCVVLVFDRNLQFLGEFGGRGFGEGDLIGPSEVAVANGLVYVTQGAHRGVSVYKVNPGS
jgi:DNA-binding beta-propeller fold protein YncE